MMAVTGRLASAGSDCSPVKGDGTVVAAFFFFIVAGEAMAGLEDLWIKFAHMAAPTPNNTSTVAILTKILVLRLQLAQNCGGQRFFFGGADGLGKGVVSPGWSSLPGW